MQEFGLFLYCISDADLNHSGEIIGIDGENTVFTVKYKELFAYASNVSMEEYGEAVINDKLEDVKWVTAQAQSFMDVLQEISRQTAVIPMKFCTIFKNSDRIIELLQTEYEKWSNIAAFIRDKQEWSFKIYCDTAGFLCKQMDTEKTEIENKLTGKSKGAAFFLRKKLEESLNDKCQERIMDISNSIFEEAREYAADYRINKLLAKEITGMTEQMFINSAFLIDKEKTGEFMQNLGTLKDKYTSQCFIIDYSGPWPLYNFISE